MRQSIRRTAQKSSVSGAREPASLLVVRRGSLGLELIEALLRDPRLEPFVVDELTQEWLGFANRSAGIVVATSEDPLSALVYALTAGVRVPVVVAASAPFKGDFGDSESAGAAGCMALPIDTKSVDRLLELFERRGATPMVDGDLRLLLDPVARVARYRKRSVRLTQREIAMLHCLISHRGRPVSFKDLYGYVWETPAASREVEQLLAVNVFRIRHKLATLGLRGMLRNVRGFGYALVQSEPRRAGVAATLAPHADDGSDLLSENE